MLVGLRPDTDSVEYKTWRQRTHVLLSRLYSPENRLTTDFDSLSFYVTEATATKWFERGRSGALAILETAIYDFEVLKQPDDPASSESIDPELWSQVGHHVQAEDWISVASQTEIFVESKLREWAGRPREEVGVVLMQAIFAPKGGEFPLGLTDGEREGWHLLARGFAGALSNVDRHRLEDRADAKRYAIGVLGTASLLLTQLRWQHGNRFRSTTK